MKVTNIFGNALKTATFVPPVKFCIAVVSQVFGMRYK